jgi:hypothetical protein
MRKAFFAMTLLSVLPLYVQAQPNSRRDGTWWNERSVGEKYSYVTGFFDGMELGHKFSYWGLLDETKDDNQQSSCVTKSFDSYKNYGDKFFNEVTSSQVADGLTEFYKDYRNRSIRVNDGVWVVVNTIAGTPQEKIDSLVQNLRKNVANEH